MQFGASRLDCWLDAGQSRSWELCVVYYGDRDDPDCLRAADHSMRMKGGKFPNLVRAMRRQLAYFRSFEAILVADDDLVISGAQLNALFEVRRAHGLQRQPVRERRRDGARSCGSYEGFVRLRAERILLLPVGCVNDTFMGDEGLAVGLRVLPPAEPP